MGYAGTRNGWGITGGRAGSHPAVVGMCGDAQRVGGLLLGAVPTFSVGLRYLVSR